jgi:hypothetical protein
MIADTGAQGCQMGYLHLRKSQIWGNLTKAGVEKNIWGIFTIWRFSWGYSMKGQKNSFLCIF